MCIEVLGSFRTFVSKSFGGHRPMYLRNAGAKRGSQPPSQWRRVSVLGLNQLRTSWEYHYETQSKLAMNQLMIDDD